METERIQQLNSLSGFSEDPCAVRLMRDEEQQALTTTTTAALLATWHQLALQDPSLGWAMDWRAGSAQQDLLTL